MTGQALGETGNRLLETLVDFINLLVLPGKVNNKATGTFYGGNSTALSKPDGGVRPIVSGHTLCRLAAKVTMRKLQSFCEKEFRPLQMGVGTPKGCEANLTLLGAPIYPEGIEAVLESKMEDLELMVGRLSKIDRHSALYLLRNCFAMLKLTYFLRSSPCFLKPAMLKRYDTHTWPERILRSKLSK